MKPCRWSMAGISFVELLVGLLLSTLVMTAALPVGTQSLRLWQQHQHQIDSRQAARFAMDFMVRQLRYTSYISLPVPNGREAGELDFQDPDLPNPSGGILYKKSVSFRLGNGAGTRMRTLYRSVPGTSQPVTEECIANLSFRRDPSIPQQVSIEFDIWEPVARQTVGHLRTVVYCPNLSLP
jgi:hypothetical protein